MKRYTITTRQKTLSILAPCARRAFRIAKAMGYEPLTANL